MKRLLSVLLVGVTLVALVCVVGCVTTPPVGHRLPTPPLPGRGLPRPPLIVPRP
jgi:hypothetical protein